MHQQQQRSQQLLKQNIACLVGELLTVMNSEAEREKVIMQLVSEAFPLDCSLPCDVGIEGGISNTTADSDML